MNRASKKRFAFLFPATFLIFVFFLIPAALCILYSFTNLALSGENAQQLRFIGLTNYAKMLGDSNVIKAMKNTLYFTFGSILGQSIIGFMTAYLVRGKQIWIRRTVGILIMAGWIIPETVAAYCMSAFFSDKGTLNIITGFLGARPVSWLFKYPMAAVVIANIWRGTAGSMINYQAALDNLDNAVLEAAAIDGCNGMNKLLRVVLPIMRQPIATNTMLITLSTLGSFGLIWIMTAGGPGGKTNTFSVLMYLKAFQNHQLGYGVAISMVLMVVGVIFGIAYTKILKGSDEK